MIVDSSIQFNGKWIRQDGTTMFTEVTTVSNTNIEDSPHSSTLRFAPLRSNSIDGGEYIYTVMVEPANSSCILQSSANLSYSLLVRQYPSLNISENIQSLECQPEEGATLFGNVSLLSDTYFDNVVTFTWMRDDVVKKNESGTQTSLMLKPLNEASSYILRVCLAVPLSGLIDYCSTTSYNIVVAGRVINLC